MQTEMADKKTALITGASRGIGKAVALRLASLGYHILALSRSGDELRALSDEIHAQGGSAQCIVVDLADARAIESTLPKAVGTLAQIDVLVNNAGIGKVAPFEEMASMDYDRMMDVNVRSTFLVTKIVLPSMKARKSGHIVSIASDVSKRTFEGGAVYCASKFAQHALMDALRREVRPHGIKVSTIYPGLVDTHFHRTPQGDSRHSTWLRPEDVAETVAFVLNAPTHVIIDEITLHPLTQSW
jgi:NADP-dependent 3-hydroxy acid dehydrogenase YdfG